MKAPTRISARLDPETGAQLAYLLDEMQQSVSTVLKRAVAAYYDQVRDRRGHVAAMLHETGFIGCAEGPGNLSTDYKAALAESLARKHGHR